MSQHELQEYADQPNTQINQEAGDNSILIGQAQDVIINQFRKHPWLLYAILILAIVGFTTFLWNLRTTVLSISSSIAGLVNPTVHPTNIPISSIKKHIVGEWNFSHFEGDPITSDKFKVHIEDKTIITCFPGSNDNRCIRLTPMNVKYYNTDTYTQYFLSEDKDIQIAGTYSINQNGDISMTGQGEESAGLKVYRISISNDELKLFTKGTISINSFAEILDLVYVYHKADS